MFMKCIRCNSEHVAKNGKETKWKGGKTYQVQRYQCRECGRSMGKRLE